ncbi:hypothetical protein Ddye_010277 [Dipteronia dyeriana]|uniref:F-box protein At3g26010-like beta-propeller domain-containing protein n=1 Tax=Dipteronia dyeriana TaxID=168575 RepID=A0AAD9XCZ7_9ROSI|nr:hypothetical protein Ddye_010277 [Dipteronia dyeriana]
MYNRKEKHIRECSQKRIFILQSEKKKIDRIRVSRNSQVLDRPIYELESTFTLSYQAQSLFLEAQGYSLLTPVNPKQEKKKRYSKQNHQYPLLLLASQVSSSCRLKMATSKDHLSPRTSEEDSSWVRILDHNVDSDSQEDLSAQTSDDETSWVKVLDHNVDSDFQEDDHLPDFGFKEDLPMKKSTSLEKNTPPPPKFDISGFFDLPDKSPGVLHASDTQTHQILELKDKSYAEQSNVEGGTHPCNFDGQISKKFRLKLKDNESLKDVIKMHALPFLPAKSLCRFRSVCKDWDERISHPFLAHQQTNKFQDISGLLCQFPFLAPSIVFFDRDAYGFPSPRFSFLPDLVNVKSTCNGLVCCQCSSEVDVYYVCNPVTEKWTKLPQPNMLHESQTVAALAFEPTAFNFAAHYQLVCAVADVLSDPPVVYFEIYSSRTNTWRVSETVCYEADALTLSNDGFYVNGNVYWKTLSGAVLIFHLYYEMYSIVQLPPNHGPQGALTHLHGELCYILPAIVDDECIISIYGNVDMSLKYEITLLQKMLGMSCQALPSVNDEMLMILLEEGVIAYHVKTKRIEFLSEERMEGYHTILPYMMGGYQTILPYINTLVGIATPSSKELETVAY